MTVPLIVPETAVHADALEALYAEVFGPGAHARAAFRLREQGPHDMRCSFVTVGGDDLVGGVRMTQISVGRVSGYLLGPLAVQPRLQKAGHGKRLVAQACSAAEHLADAAFVLLVGDAPYYASLGFAPAPRGQVRLPGPVEPHRLLVRSLNGFDTANLIGTATHRNITTHDAG